MSLFGGRQSASSSSNTRNNINSGLGWGRPTASSRHSDERESLIPASASTSDDDFDDSDAISLLSNIADRDSRRGASSAAARRRARARSRAQGRTCATFMFDLEDWGRAMSCGLLGRSANNDESSGRQRAASIGSVMSRGARRNNQPSTTSSGSSIHATSRHSRSVSDASTDSAGSLVGSGFDVDADAGMLDDQAIARFGRPTPASASDAEAEAAKAKAQAERQKAIQAEALRLQQEAEAETQRQKEEEARLAAEEEAAIAKARRKAERKAAKAGLLKLQQETQAAQRWRTEAEAEAAAGGFGLADGEGEEQQYEQGYEGEYPQPDFDCGDERDQMHGAEYDQYGDAEEGGEDEGYYATVEEHGPGGVVHHHHYYHAAPSPAQEQYGCISPNPIIQDPSPAVEEEASADKTVSEDEADIAGLSFGRKKSKSRNKDGSAGSRSGSGLTARTFPHTGGSSSGGSASGHRGPTSACSSSGRPNYRDKPRRHERTSSKSSNSSSGIFSYQSSNTLYHHAPPSTAATSVTSPLGLPNLYESEPIYSTPGARRDGEGRKADEQEEGEVADPNADEFGVMTAAGNAVTNKAGAKRVKKSYRDKRNRSQLMGEGVDEGGEDKFEGFPGF